MASSQCARRRGGAMKIAICIPSLDHVPIEFALSLAALCTYEGHRKKNQLVLINVKSSTIPEARNLCVEKALQIEADKLLFIDSDMVFRIDALERLLQSGLDVIGAAYPKRIDGGLLNFLAMPSRDEYNDAEIEPVRGIGMGFMLIDANVIKKLQKPWFEWGYFGAETLREVGIEEGRTFMSEDYYFCLKVRASQCGVFMDKLLTLQMGHVGSKVYLFGDAIPSTA